MKVRIFLLSYKLGIACYGKDVLEFKIFIILTRTFKFYLGQVILNDSSCKWNIGYFYRYKS